MLLNLKKIQYDHSTEISIVIYDVQIMNFYYATG